MITLVVVITAMMILSDPLSNNDKCNYRITTYIGNEERVYYTNDINSYDGSITFTDVSTGREITLSHFMVEELK